MTLELVKTIQESNVSGGAPVERIGNQRTTALDSDTGTTLEEHLLMRAVVNLVWLILAGSVWRSPRDRGPAPMRHDHRHTLRPKVFKRASYRGGPFKRALVPRSTQSEGLFVVGNIPFTPTRATRRNAGIEI
jgi:hypothetical protein